MKSVNRVRMFFRIFFITIGVLTITAVSTEMGRNLINRIMPSAFAQTKDSNVDKVNYIAVVKTAPKEMQAGIYSMVVELRENEESPLTMEAITCQPNTIKVGDKVRLFSVMPPRSLDINGPHSIYYIAVPADNN